MKQLTLLGIASPALLFFLGAIVCAGCASTHSSLKGDSAWLEPSPRLRAEIEDSARRLPWTHGMERIDLITWFAGVGEPAYPTLLEMVQDPRADVAGSALAALGATRDSRLVEPMRALPLPEGPDSTDLKLERARALLRLGDWQVLPDLIAGLRDERLLTRALCAQALWESTHEKFGYDPKGEADDRAKSVAQWEAWWHDRSLDPLQHQENGAALTSRSAPVREPQ